MILDNQALFSDKQAITVDAASTNVIKFKGEVAFGTPIEILGQIVQDFKSAEVASIDVKLQTDDAEGFASPTTLVTETLSAITAGTRFNLKYLPKGNEGYMRLYYDVTFKTGVSAATSGKITAGVVDGQPESYHNA
jgi:hypothetical protein